MALTTHTQLWDELQPQLCPCKGLLASDVFSLLLHPYVACENTPIARQQSHLSYVFFGALFFFVNTQSLHICILYLKEKSSLYVS